MNKKIKIVLIAILLLAVFAVGVLFGINYGVKDALFNESGEVEISKVLNLYSNTRKDSVDFEQFWKVWDKIHKDYVDPQKINDTKLFYSAVSGMIAGLEDPYSVYFSPEKAAEFTETLSGEFEGIGAELAIKDNKLIVVAPLPDSPAEKTGLKSGDIILAIDENDVYGLSVEEAVAKIKGEKGTIVKLKIARGEEIFDLEITREVLNRPTIYLEEKKDGIFYLSISDFNEKTWDEFEKNIKKVIEENQKIKAIILDLRSNPGGFLDTAVKISSEWIENGVIVSEKFNDNKENVYETIGNHRLKNIKTIVLIDEGTASSAEIVAGALQDQEKATVIGKKSFGKGSVQEYEILLDGSALKLTIAKWFTPNGTAIDGIGIKPNIEVEEMFIQKDGTSGDKVEDYIDVGLEKAMELLN
ncbi:MAG: S41 family peptidase [Patescibacteria group bacterium]